LYTADFSRAPATARAGAVFYGGTRYSGVWALIRLGWRWPRFRRELRRAPGYLGHHVWYSFPFTVGNVSFWESQQHLMAFARTPAHKQAAAWMVSPGVSRAGFIRYLTPLPVGNSLGEWHVPKVSAVAPERAEALTA
jgi:heme-degrading monooxygenase HmoA